MKIHIRETDDWIAVYKDGQCVWQTHRCSLSDGLEALGIEFTSEWKDPDWQGDALPDFFVETLEATDD